MLKCFRLLTKEKRVKMKKILLSTFAVISLFLISNNGNSKSSLGSLGGDGMLPTVTISIPMPSSASSFNALATRAGKDIKNMTTEELLDLNSLLIVKLAQINEELKNREQPKEKK